jgi:putative transposase
LDEVFVKINGKLCYPWRAADHGGEALQAVVTSKRDKAAARKLLKRQYVSNHLTTDNQSDGRANR